MTTEPNALRLLHPDLPRLAKYLRVARPQVERDLRTAGFPLPPDVAELWDALDALALAAERPEPLSGTSGTLRLPDPAPAQILPTMSTTDAAELLGTTARAVRARLERGTLAGRLVGGSWQVDAGAVRSLARRSGGGAA